MTIFAPIPMEHFGRDHESTFVYLETRCVDHDGIVDPRHLRENPEVSPARGNGGNWHDAYASRLLSPHKAPKGHDDWCCIQDFVDAGLVLWRGTGTQPVFVLTDKGWAYAARLRRERAERGMKARFKPEWWQ